MTALILAASTFAVSVTFFHVASLVLAIRRFRRSPGRGTLSEQLPAVTLVRPLCGLDNYAADTLSSTFALDYPHYEILFCVASAKDPVVPLVRALIEAHPGTRAKLLIGDDRVSNNPKLNNVLKGWRAAAHDWIVIADSNVLMPPDYIQLLFASWQEDTGLVASPPIGCRPEGFWAQLECAFLNGYQARWQYAADSLGYGFAQGKTMLWRRADLDSAGGIPALTKEVAEDAAATKVVRSAGLKVRLVDRPFAQPLGRRTATEVWNRQLRWARLRRASFFLYFLPEILSGGVLPMIAVGIVANGAGISAILAAATFGAFWYGGEMLLAACAGWPVSPLSPLYGLVRDLLLPPLFFSALHGNDFVWRGNEMQVERMRARRVIALARPRVHRFAQGGRRRLRALRARALSATSRLP
ncbi:MAG TPA: ceramide glucosyltransferase [Xanthobacteraceae bacterium]|nr:ceramide glucosyltransferase [Xanthobacteraceae bacterium]